MQKSAALLLALVLMASVALAGCTSDGKTDSDGDGIRDAADYCPNDPEYWKAVNEHRCADMVPAPSADCGDLGYNECTASADCQWNDNFNQCYSN